MKQKRKNPSVAKGVMLIRSDGSVFREFYSRTDVAAFLGVSVASVSIDIRRGFLCKGYKIINTDDYTPYMDYSFRHRFGHRPDGTLTSDGARVLSRKMWKNDDGTLRKAKSEHMRRVIRRLAAEGRAYRPCVPVVCIDEAIRFPSINSAATHYGVSLRTVQKSIHNCRATKQGHYFRRMRPEEIAEERAKNPNF